MRTHSFIISLMLGLQTLFVSVPAVSDAGNLITVIVADTYDFSIGDSTSVDLIKMRALMSKVSMNTDMRLNEVVLRDDQTTAENMLKSIKSLKVQEDDVVVFYFSGHGYRTPSKGDSLWPNLYFSIRDEGVEYEKVVSILQKKNPRLLITVSDVCNNMISDESAPSLARALILRGEVEKKVGDNYRRLFLETTGLIRVTSSQAGEFSWATKGGGTFTLAFLKNMENEVKSSAPADWENLLDRTALEMSRDQQHPVYVIETTKSYLP